MKGRIVEELESLERERGIRVLYACESGSRAWGFASRDSDYDPRFIYVLPPEHYLCIREPDDTIDFPIEDGALDLTGWELRKALRLFQKSNASLFEWLRSPIVYREEKERIEEWRNLVPEFFLPLASASHYAGLAKSFWRRPLQEECVPAKKYLYCLRALLAARWIIERREPIPVPFRELREGIDLEAGLDDAIEEMIAAKAGQDEREESPRHAFIHDCIAKALPEIEKSCADLPGGQNGHEALDAFFRKVLEKSRSAP